MITIIILLTLLTQPAPPLRATWERPGVARVVHSAGCLYRNQTFIRCYERGGVLLLGSVGPLDGAYRGQVGDLFRLVKPDGSIEQARIKSVLYFPVMR